MSNATGAQTFFGFRAGLGNTGDNNRFSATARAIELDSHDNDFYGSRAGSAKRPGSSIVLRERRRCRERDQLEQFLFWCKCG
jgi:hypothetical protein